MSDAVLKVENLKVHFPVKGGLFTKKQVVKAVDGVSFEIYPKEMCIRDSGSSLYKDAVVYAILILILIIKPAGLLGKNVKEKV